MEESSNRLKDFPTYNDETFLDFVEALEIQREIIRDIIRFIIDQNTNCRVTIGILVSILDRQSECTVASVFLASRKFFRDSATLILTIMELRLDLEFIAKSSENELKWLSQDRGNKKLWNVKDQISAVSKDSGDAEADHDIYKFLSIIKHGNPTYGHLAFTISTKPDRILFDSKNSVIDPKLMIGILFEQINRSFEATLIISERNGIDLNEFKSRMSLIKESLEEKAFAYVTSMIKSSIVTED